MSNKVGFTFGIFDDCFIDEFIGLAKGLTVNGTITDEGIKLLKNWLKANDDQIEDYPLNIVYDVVSKIKLKAIKQEDKNRVYDLLTKIAGGEQLIENQTTKLPLDDPQPEIEIKEHTFCFTGSFTFAPREIIKDKVTKLGGKVLDRVTTKLDYLVIGSLASDGWAHSNFGRKIEDAVRFKLKFGKPCILSEETLTKYL